MRATFSLGALLLVAGPAAFAAAQERDDADDSAESVALSLARALDARLTVWERPGGEVVHVSHCRSYRDRGRCRARIAAFARWITEAARRFGFEAFVLAAMAVRESGLDPFAQGAAGELGIIQLHPRGVGRSVRFVQSESYRARCRREPGACQREVLLVGAEHLSQAIDRCGSLEEGLTAYNRGACGDSDYAARVLRERRVLLELAKTDATPPAMRN